VGSLVNSGWVKLWREMLSKAIWSSSSPEQKTVLITVLLLANHERNEWIWKGEKYSCNAGQLITSLRSLQEACGDGVSMQNVRTALVKFEKLGFLTNESTKTGRLITIVNWAKYQGDGESTNKAFNKEVTKHSQSTNKALTPNKNDKNDKNDKKRERARTRFSPPTLDEVAAYCRERNNNIDPQHFLDYYQRQNWRLANGVHMADWKAAVRTWERRDKEQQQKQADRWGNDPDQRKEYGGEIDWGC